MQLAVHGYVSLLAASDPGCPARAGLALKETESLGMLPGNSSNPIEKFPDMTA
jgi:hypothetical protein